MNRYKTPLRYPGGKQKLAPFVREILSHNDLVGGEYAEPYAGGAGVAMELLLDGTVSTVHLNDSSVPVFSFWSSLVNESDKLIKLIEGASMNVDEWKRQREILNRYKEFSQLEVGFSLFYLNRCNRSGIPTAGVIGGLAQTGKWKMDARFSRSDLIHRIELIALKKNSIKVYNQDAETFIQKVIPKTPRETLVYCDPPYYNKASRLYLDHYLPEDHKDLAETIQDKLKRPWIVSYDSVPEIVGFYSKRKHFTYDLQYNAAKAYKGKEVFIFSDKLEVPSSSSISSIDQAIRSI